MAGSPDIVPFDTDTDNKNAVNMNDLNNVDGDIVNKGTVHDMTAEDRNTALQLAMKADPGVPAFSGRMFGLCAMLTVVLMCGGDAGFDGTVMGAVNSMDQFKDYFNINVHDQSLIFGMYTVGQVTAFFPSSTIPDIVGRRWSMFVGNTCLICGALFTSQAKQIHMFIGGRFLTGLGCTMAASSAKMYMSEITPPATRGRWLGLQNSFYYVGQLLASGISIPFGRHNSSWAWRAPLLLQALPAAINVCFILLLPESPRWLYSRGHKEKATKIMARLHSRDKDVNSPLIRLQIGEIEENISLDGADKRWWDFRTLLRNRASRYRFGMAAIISVWGTFSGNDLITYFLPTLLEQAGILSSDRQRVLNFVNSVTSFASALTGTALTDFIGRRKLLLSASTACMFGMTIAAGLFSPSGKQSDARANAGITIIYLFMCCYSFGYTPLQALYPAECISFENRAKGVALQTLLGGALALINTFAMPIALDAITYRTYIIFAVVDLVGVLVIWKWAVETKRLTLEDLDHVFSSANPKETSFQLARIAKERTRGQVREGGLAADDFTV